MRLDREFYVALGCLVMIIVFAIGIVLLANVTEIYEDGSITMFGVQVACKSGYPCDDENAGTDTRYGYLGTLN